MKKTIAQLLQDLESPELEQALEKIFSSDADLHELHEKLAILLTISRDPQVIAALILLPLFECGLIKAQDLSSGINDLLQGITRFTFVRAIDRSVISNPERHHEALRKMLLSISRDIRVVFIILTIQLYRMRNIKQKSLVAQQSMAEETRKIYAPLANRLGMWTMKWELEDLSFRYLEPNEYHKIARLLTETRSERDDYIAKIIVTLKTELTKSGINADISGRPKHIYSIYRKMARKNLEFKQLYDLRAVRVLTGTEADCYTVLGIIHNLWTPVPKEFDDYISNPKANNYQSLHTAVRAFKGKVVEVQIRTGHMHELAESGVAAHWRYKENVKFDPGFETRVKWLRELINWKDELGESALENFRDELADEFIYVLTPDGEVIELPEGSTALDFAYKIHSGLGHKTRGAKLDGKIIPLSAPLTTGGQIEILTAKEGKPSRDWMNPNFGYLKTSSARAKVRSWFRRFNFEENTASGRQILNRETRKLGIKPDIASLAKRLHCKSEEDLLVKIGIGDISLSQLAGDFQREFKEHEETAPRNLKKTPAQKYGFIIDGTGGMLSKIAPCCHPLPGDNILGYITQGKGVSVHRDDCNNILHLAATNKERIIAVKWAQSGQEYYETNIFIKAYNRADLLRDITSALNLEKVRVYGFNTMEDKDDELLLIKIKIAITSLVSLSRIIDKIGQIKNVIDVYREFNKATQ